MTQILVLLGFLAAGAIIASFSWAPGPRIVEASIRAALWLLLFSMGFRIGNNPGLVNAIGTIGLMGLVSAVVTIVGSCLAILFFSRIWPASGIDGRSYAKSWHGNSRDSKSGTAGGSVQMLARLKAPAILLAIVAGGFLAGIILPRLVFDPGIVTEWTLNLLLFLIGMQFRQSRIPLDRILKSPALLLLPLVTAMGSLAGGLLLAPIFSLRVPRALALAGGFGWYSLSGVLIGNLGDPVLGSAAFLANMMRESIGLIVIPVLAESRIPSMAIGVAGATAMDVSLPLIEQSLGPESVPLSFMSGAVLSLLVPLLVPLFMGM